MVSDQSQRQALFLSRDTQLRRFDTGDEFVRGFRVGLPLTEFKSKVVVFSKDMGTKTCLP